MAGARTGRFRVVIRVVEPRPQSLVDVELLDDVLVLDVCEVADHKVDIVNHQRINEKWDELIRVRIETDRWT